MRKIRTLCALALVLALLCLCSVACKEHTEHIYDSPCDADCNECEELRDPPHVYDHACDAACNVCETTRNVPPHAYDHACDTDCNACGATRETTHTYDRDCDTDCNVCGAVREAMHTYDHDCDINCNVCGALRETAHAYDHDCDTKCNVCGATRETQHVYDNDCDTKCNSCQKSRAVPHVYDTPCDAVCNACDGERAAYAHSYDGACDNECNNCGALRVVQADHRYAAACDATCDECGAVRTVFTEHTYWSDCISICQSCGEMREAAAHTYDTPCTVYCSSCYDVNPSIVHTYDGESDLECNLCGMTRTAPAQCGNQHAYAFACDTICDACGTARTDITHTYDHACDTDCNVCGASRAVESHIGVAKDGICDACGLLTVPLADGQDARDVFAAAFNQFISNIHLMSRHSLFSGNYCLSDIAVSGDMADEAEIPYTSVAFYPDFICYEQPHAYCTDAACLQQSWYVNSEDGWYYLERAEGEWVVLYDMTDPYLPFSTSSMLPPISVKDIRYYPDKATVYISDAYMKKLLTLWYQSGLTSYISITNSIDISIADLMPYLSSGTLETVITLSESGSVRAFRLTLCSPMGNKCYELSYEKNSDGIFAHALWGEDAMTLQLTPGDGCSVASFAMTRGEGEYARDLSITAKIYEDLEAYVPDAEMQQTMYALEQERLMQKTIAARYAGVFKRTSGNCTDIAVYDEEYQCYIYFYEKNGTFRYRSYSPTLTLCCEATINLAKRTLTPTKHAPKEALEIAMAERYEKIVVSADAPCEAIAVYDEEHDSYALFLMMIDGSYIYAGHTDLPSVLMYFCKGEINLKNGKITVKQHVHLVEQEGEDVGG